MRSREPSPKFTSRQDIWIDTKAGRFAIPHLCLGAFIVTATLLNDFNSFIVLKALTVLVTVTAFGILTIYFIAQADIRDSERYARYGRRLAVAYLCFIVGVVFISWTYLIGYAFLSLVYLAESAILLVIAWRTARELRQ